AYPPHHHLAHRRQIRILDRGGKLDRGRRRAAALARLRLHHARPLARRGGGRRVPAAARGPQMPDAGHHHQRLRRRGGRGDQSPRPRARHQLADTAAQADRSRAAARHARADPRLLGPLPPRKRLTPPRKRLTPPLAFPADDRSSIMTDQNNPDERRSSAALLVATITLIAAILGGNLFFINNLRDSLLLDADC